MSKRTLSVPLSLIALVLAGLSLALPSHAYDSADQVSAAASVQNAPKMPNEVVIVNRFGVYPAEITRPKGPFALVIRNGRGSREETFTIVRDGRGASDGAPALGRLATTARRPQAISVIDLPPGTYRLAFGNEPNFSVKLTIR